MQLRIWELSAGELDWSLPRLDKMCLQLQSSKLSEETITIGKKTGTCYINVVSVEKPKLCR